MQHDDEPAVLGCTERLGLAPKRDALTRLKRLYELLAHGRSVDGYLGADALAAGIAEIEALRAELDRCKGALANLMADAIDCDAAVAAERERIINALPGGRSVDPQWVADMVRWPERA